MIITNHLIYLISKGYHKTTVQRSDHQELYRVHTHWDNFQRNNLNNETCVEDWECSFGLQDHTSENGGKNFDTIQCHLHASKPKNINKN